MTHGNWHSDLPKPQPRGPWCRCGFAGCSDADRAVVR